jgi:uncharacterized protein involved in oxidation of intracellular sulfur
VRTAGRPSEAKLIIEDAIIACELTTLISMKLGLILTCTEPELAFNALRLANFALQAGDSVKVFLMGQGVELDQIDESRFKVREQAEAFVTAGGQFLACGTCLKIRNSEGSDMCPLSTMRDLHAIIRDSDRLLTF